MKYLKSFTLLDDYKENIIVSSDSKTIYNNYYPLHIFPLKSLEEIKFDDVTIFYGGNGSGKSTILNIIAEKLKAIRKNAIDKGPFFSNYIRLCEYEMAFERPIEIKIVTSDDVFDYLLDIRSINSNINRRKEALGKEYLEAKYNHDGNNFDNYEELKRSVEVKRQSMSKYIRTNLRHNNIIEQSNGESALLFWEHEIKDNSIYILDEPENSLSAENQLKLKQFIEDSTRFYNCQFIISTHSPFLLNINDAKIYDLDGDPACCKKWYELNNVKVYYNFFKEHENEFK